MESKNFELGSIELLKALIYERPIITLAGKFVHDVLEVLSFILSERHESSHIGCGGKDVLQKGPSKWFSYYQGYLPVLSPCAPETPFGLS
jgi:hypothetical protein